PVSEGHKLIQNFLQSLEPPLLVGGCPSISPVHLRSVRFTDLGYFFPKFLDTLDTNFSIQTVYSSEGWRLKSSGRREIASFPRHFDGFAVSVVNHNFRSL